MIAIFHYNKTPNGFLLSMRQRILLKKSRLLHHNKVFSTFVKMLKS